MKKLLQNGSNMIKSVHIWCFSAILPNFKKNGSYMMLITRIWLEYASYMYEQTTIQKSHVSNCWINQKYVVLRSSCGFMGISNYWLNQNTSDYYSEYTIIIIIQYNALESQNNIQSSRNRFNQKLLHHNLCVTTSI